MLGEGRHNLKLQAFWGWLSIGWEWSHARGKHECVDL